MRLGTDAAVAIAIGLSRTQLSRVRGGSAELSEYRRAALRAVAAGEPVPPRPAGKRVTVALTDDEADRLWNMAADHGQPLSAVLSEAIVDWLAWSQWAPPRSTVSKRRAPHGTRWRSYRVEPAALAALLARVGTGSPGQAIREAVLKKTTTASWNATMAEMTTGLCGDDAAAVEEMALTLLSGLPFPTLYESRLALSFCRDKLSSERAST